MDACTVYNSLYITYPDFAVNVHTFHSQYSTVIVSEYVSYETDVSCLSLTEGSKVPFVVFACQLFLSDRFGSFV